MLAKYHTKFLTKDKKVHSVVLSSVHLLSFRESIISSLGKKDLLLMSRSVMVWMDWRISSKMFDLEMLES